MGAESATAAREDKNLKVDALIDRQPLEGDTNESGLDGKTTSGCHFSDQERAR